jgi:hypothetical protein
MIAKEVTGAVWSAAFASDLLLRGKGLSITQSSERLVKKSLPKPQRLAQADFCRARPEARVPWSKLNGAEMATVPEVDMNRRNQNYPPPNSVSLAHPDSKAEKFLNQEWLWIGAISVLLFVIGKVVVSIASTWLITTFRLTSSFLSF